ncbi:bifunctional glycosyltransferase family 2/GtrA family protein [Microbacterium marmarense]|uniref:Bifunctional glycosyltransferase family 2/GtrA family protein n=1 Tax=Microbacterium marmarense TaxID=3122051 RepID=A0ABU8LSG5_9MICO
MIVLIPAFEPGAHLAPLTRRLRESDVTLDVLVVDDGSGAAFAAVFDEVRRAGAHVVQYSHNRGKGAAMKTGIRDVLEQWPGHDVITADADGQHTVADILRVADELRADRAAGKSVLLLGCRDFVGDVPLRSRVGNDVSRGLFRVAAGWSASDTQTGLRGLPSDMLPWLLEVPGDRFEYETEMLLRLRGAGYRAREIAIETVYLEQNESSHFRPIADSLRVTLPMLLFAGSSLIAFALDTVALLIFAAVLSPWLGSWLAVSIVGARVLSASANFWVNRRFVFAQRGRRQAGRHAVRYAILAIALLASNIVWMSALTDLGMSLIAAKIMTETVLFITSYHVQRRFVFGGKMSVRPSDARPTSQDRQTAQPSTVPEQLAAPSLQNVR